VKSAVIDTSSAILLLKADLLEKLIARYQILIPQTVYNELTKENQFGSNKFSSLFKKNVLHLKNEYKEKKVEFPLHGGEKDTVLLYLQGKCDFIIIDDRKGIRFCKQNSIPFINALIVPKILYFIGDIDHKQYCTKTNLITQIGRYSYRVLDLAQKINQKDLEIFFP